jgi:hypothetical protein
MSTFDHAAAEAASRVGVWALLADGLRQAHLEDVDRVQAAVEAGQYREVARRAARYGAGSVVALEGEARLQAAALFRSEIQAELARIDEQSSPAEAGAAVIRGRVVDRALEAVPGVSVRAVDQAGALMAADTTNGQGHFRLQISPGPTGEAPEGAQAGKALPTTGVILIVSDEKGGMLYRDEEPSIVPAGAMVYRDVLVAGSAEAEPGARHQVYHVTPDPTGGWKVQAEGSSQPTSTHPTKKEAVAHGRELAKGHGRARLIVHRKDGRIESEYTYGHDPRRAPR